MALVQELTAASGFVFEAQVLELGASSASTYAASPETVTARVTRVLRSPSVFANYAGQTVTVVLGQSSSVQAGQTVVFFTHGLHYGNSLVLREVGNLAPEASMDSDVNSAVQAQEDSQLAERLAGADRVITGTVSGPHALPRRADEPISEHEPQWWSATVQVEKVHKGESKGSTETVVFSNSKDVAWHKSPKLKDGDRGVFLLHSKDHKGRPTPGLAIVHPLDFQPFDQEPRVQRLLQGQ